MISKRQPVARALFPVYTHRKRAACVAATTNRGTERTTMMMRLRKLRRGGVSRKKKTKNTRLAQKPTVPASEAKTTAEASKYFRPHGTIRRKIHPGRKNRSARGRLHPGGRNFQNMNYRGNAVELEIWGSIDYGTALPLFRNRR
ncbi:uncharacterized protein LOC143174274 [Nomia melanderi]|uniref:uncharacterized protein LOC143174274 n=1 Tax=Nomia melanderi TaxID=2448451 RepID=UPI003FCEA427